MALIFIDGFDHFSTDLQLRDKGYTAATASYFSFLTGRFGGKLLELTDYDAAIVKNLGVNKSTLYFGAALKKTEVGIIAVNSSRPLIRFLDESSVTQISICPTADYGFAVYRDTTLLGSTGDSLFEDNKWIYLEVKVVISDTVGVVEIEVNETQVLNLTSQDTKNGSDYMRFIRLGAMSMSRTVNWDDMYIDDAQFHGNCRIRTFMPDLDGNSADFTRSSGSNDYECVDEVGSNEDTDYISSDTLNHKSIFGITTGALGTVKGIQLNNHCRIDEAGTRKIKPIVRSNATDYQGAETDLITADYIFEHDIWELDPDDSAAWTQTKLEAAEFGLEITT